VDGPFNGGAHYYQGSQSENPVNPRVSVSWQQNEDDMYYMTAAKGFVRWIKFPAIHYSNVRSGLTSFRPVERHTATYILTRCGGYEIGAKMRFADRRLRLDGSAFHIDWKNIQNLAQIKRLWNRRDLQPREGDQAMVSILRSMRH